ncbi:MerR family transcriptional regulator [Actinacidiphila reveromycinica]|uniref:MerR family transcriptional regulator n=1 Tax=Actinacidiphila reveromycinica TaxID=659352 RepID=UPI003211C245
MTTTWLTAGQAVDHANRIRALCSAGNAGCTERTLRSWVARGHLPVAGLDDGGRQLFTLADVARAELATRARALRLASTPGAAPRRGLPHVTGQSRPTGALHQGPADPPP